MLLPGLLRSSADLPHALTVVGVRPSTDAPGSDGSFRALSERPDVQVDVRGLQRQAEDLLLALRDLEGDAPLERRPPLALRQLLRGRATDRDVRDLGLPLQGARVCVLQVCDLQSQRAAARLLAARDRTIVDVVAGTEEITFLVPDLPRRVGANPSRDAATRSAVAVQHLAGVGPLGVSGALVGPACGPRAYREATTLSWRTSDRGAVFADDAWCELAAADLRQHVLRTLPVTNPVRLLVDSPEALSLELAVSVGTWLDEGGDTRRAAARLFLHPNTLRYRLRRAQDLCGIDLDDPDVRMLARLILPLPVPAPA